MAIARDYIPSGDANFDGWITNFAGLLTGSPEAYGLTAGDAAAMQSLRDAWHAAYIIAINGATRGPATISTKDAAKASAIIYARLLATAIQADPDITEEQKISLRITVRKTNRTPIPDPTSSPLLNLIGATPQQHTMRFADQLTPDSRSKPFGVTSLELRVEIKPIGTPPDGTISRQSNITRNPVGINFAPADVGKMAYYTARWATQTGKLGPVSMAISGVIF